VLIIMVNLKFKLTQTHKPCITILTSDQYIGQLKPSHCEDVPHREMEEDCAPCIQFVQHFPKHQQLKSAQLSRIYKSTKQSSLFVDIVNNAYMN
jgi:hypothetical protein